MEKDGKYSLVLVIAITTFVVAVIGTTFSYFTAESVSYGYDISAQSFDSLVITSADDIDLIGDAYNETFRTLYLKDASVDKMCYSVDLNILENGFVGLGDKNLLLSVSKEDILGTHDLLLNYDITRANDVVHITNGNTVNGYAHDIKNNTMDKLYFKVVNASYPNNIDKVFKAKIKINKVECN